MPRNGTLTLGLCGTIILATSALGLAGGNETPHQTSGRPGSVQNAAITEIQSSPIGHAVEVIDRFFAAHPGNDFLYMGSRIDQVYGPAFSFGASPLQSAETFRHQFAGIWNVAPEDLVLGGPFEDGHSQQQIMYIPETGTYKFTGVYYNQQRDNVPVFRGRLILLTRNEPNYPLVLASAAVRDLGNFHVAPNATVNTAKALSVVRGIAGKNAIITGGETFIWGGYDEISVPATGPALALQYIAEAPTLNGIPYRWLFLIDAANGTVYFSESQVHDVDVSGNVSGKGTSNYSSWNCSTPVTLPIPYAKVTITGGGTAYTDANGNYTIPNAGSSPVTVTASLQSLAFTQHHQNSGGATTSLSASVTPPGPGNFLFNPSSTENPTAEVNTFIAAHFVRNLALSFNPTYPSASTHTGFPINTNIALTCNAYYSANTINFYIAGGGCANTGFSSVLYHEYGHYLVEKAGSGQGAYGEGQGDVMSVVCQDTSCLGDGFQGCGNCLRDANNTCQYQTSGCSSCGSEIHDCGRLLAGCVWSVRNNLIVTNPLLYRQILGNLAVNSMLLHTGSTINNAITTHYLTLDDNDADITNGTPHYTEINNGFTAHNMPGPALSSLLFNYPNGKPSTIAPAGGTTMRVNVTAGSSTPQPNTGKLFVSTGGAYTQYSMTQVSANVYDAVFPAVPCGSNVRYYVSAQSTTSQTVNSPTTAPTAYYEAIGAVAMGAIVFNDNFNSNLGWTITNSGTLTAGGWERAVPRTDCSRGNPLADGDASGSCYLTQNANGPAGDICNSDIDGGSTTLTSPNMDASGTAYVLSYYRWYDNINAGNTSQDDAFVVQFSINGGSSWLPLETVGPTGSEVDGGWFFKQFSMNSVAGFTPTTQFRVRFTAQDLGTASVVEAAVDGVKLQQINCTQPVATGACCTAGNCTVVTSAACTSGGGTYQGDNSTCGQVSCPQPTGACCTAGNCTVVTATACTSGGGTYQGNGVTCGAVQCPQPCPADVSNDGQVNVTDLLAVINAYGPCAGCPADINHDGQVNVTDLLAVINAWGPCAP